MLLKFLTNGKVSGTGQMRLDGGIFGGVLITTNGVDAAVITVTDATGSKILDLSSPAPGFIASPIFSGSKNLSYSVTGTGASAQFYEWIP